MKNIYFSVTQARKLNDIVFGKINDKILPYTSIGSVTQYKDAVIIGECNNGEEIFDIMVHVNKHEMSGYLKILDSKTSVKNISQQIFDKFYPRIPRDELPSNSLYSK